MKLAALLFVIVVIEFHTTEVRRNYPKFITAYPLNIISLNYCKNGDILYFVFDIEPLFIKKNAKYLIMSLFCQL